MNATLIKYIILSFAVATCAISCDKTMDTELKNHTLPIVKLNTNDKYLWSTDSGLYVVGTNGIEACGKVANYNQKWEYPATIEYMENGETVFNESVGFRIKGYCSRGRSSKSFGIYWRSEYGEKKLEYPMFESIELEKYKRLLLRTSANDITHMKDVLMSTIYKDFANVDYQEYKPCALYLNEEYWGLYYIRELITPHHFKYHYGVDDDAVDLLGGNEADPEVDDGSKEDYMSEVINFVASNALSDQDNYLTLCDKIDISSYMDYIIINTYIAKCDWPGNNGKWWRDATSADYKKWRWVTYDADWSFNLVNVEDILIGELYGSEFKQVTTSGFYLFNHLIENEEFKVKFLDRYMYFIDEVFEKKRVEQIVINIEQEIEDEYPRHSQRWSKPSVGQWEKVVDDLVTFNNERNDIMRNIIYTLQNND